MSVKDQSFDSLEKTLMEVTIPAQFLFSKEQDDKLNFTDKELVLLKPYGLSLNNETTRPFLILKSENGEATLPVAINPLEAGIALNQTAAQTAGQIKPHRFLQILLESLNIKIESCIFIEIKGTHQYVRLYMKGHPKYQSLKLKAEEAMSLCVSLEVPIYATKEFIQKSKFLTLEVAGLAKAAVKDVSILTQLMVNKKDPKQCH